MEGPAVKWGLHGPGSRCREVILRAPARTRWAASTTNQADMRGLPEEQSRMTVVRRELPPSRERESSGSADLASHSSDEDSPIVPASSRGRRRSGTSETLPSTSSWIGHDGYAAAAGLVSSHSRPDEPDQLARDRRHGHRRSFAVADEMAIAAMQALLCPPRLARRSRGLPFTPAASGRGRWWDDAGSARRPRRGPAARDCCRPWSARRDAASRPRSTRSARARGRP